MGETIPKSSYGVLRWSYILYKNAVIEVDSEIHQISDRFYLNRAIAYIEWTLQGVFKQA